MGRKYTGCEIILHSINPEFVVGNTTAVPYSVLNLRGAVCSSGTYPTHGFKEERGKNEVDIGVHAACNDALVDRIGQTEKALKEAGVVRKISLEPVDREKKAYMERNGILLPWDDFYERATQGLHEPTCENIPLDVGFTYKGRKHTVTVPHLPGFIYDDPEKLLPYLEKWAGAAHGTVDYSRVFKESSKMSAHVKGTQETITFENVDGVWSLKPKSKNE